MPGGLQLIRSDIDENIYNVDRSDQVTLDHAKFVLMTDRTSVQTGVTCPRPGSYMVENFGASVRTEIPHEALLRSQFVRAGM